MVLTYPCAQFTIFNLWKKWRHHLRVLCPFKFISYFTKITMWTTDTQNLVRNDYSCGLRKGTCLLKLFSYLLLYHYNLLFPIAYICFFSKSITCESTSATSRPVVRAKFIRLLVNRCLSNVFTQGRGHFYVDKAYGLCCKRGNNVDRKSGQNPACSPYFTRWLFFLIYKDVSTFSWFSFNIEHTDF